MKNEFKPDSIVSKIIGRFTSRAEMGFNKYGTDLDRKDLTVTEWHTHLIEELHDAILYTEKARQESIKQNRLIELLLSEQFLLNSDEVNELNELIEWYESSKK
jgi:hypothetical protein